MVLALCLTLLPTAALAEELGPVDGTSTVETAGADAEAEAKAKAGAEAVAAVQAMIGELPSLGELKGMDSDTLNEAYMAVQSAYDAYEALSEEQQAQVTGADCFEGLFGWFNSQVAVLEDSGNIYPDVVDADGGITAGTTFNRNGPIVEGSNDSTTFYSNQYYVVKESSNVTINGDLIIDSCTNNGLILCKGATLTVTGALIHKGGTFPIYGVSDSGKNAGRLVIRNSSGSGAAIRSSEENAQLQINSGELEISGGSSSKLVEGVELHNASKIYAATLSGDTASYKAWSEQSSLDGTSLVLEYCGHSSDYERYVDNGNGTHHMKCDLCGFEWTEGEYFQLNHQYDKYEKIDEIYHKATCVCGYEASAQEHKFETRPDNKPVWTSDGKGHVSGVCACGYSSGTVKAHDYDESGTCKDCEFKPAFEDSKGNLYEYKGSDSIDALNEAIKKGETSFKLVNFAQGVGADTATVEAAFALETDANVTLDMNGKTLKASGGTPVLTVSSGALTVTGNAAIIQGGASQEMYKPAIEVTGGSLVFEGDLTAQGGKYGNYDRQPAVKATGGTLRLKEGDVLNGGVSVEGSTAYANVNALLGENLAFAKVGEISAIVKGDVKSISEDVTVVTHPHSFTLGSDGEYVCACGYTCPHNDFMDGKCTICGNGCAHTNVDENGVCENCKTQMVAKIEVGDKTTYTTDLGTTLYEAADGTKITLLANAAVGAVNLKGKTVTLDLNGKTVKNSGGGSAPIRIGLSSSSAKLIITGSGSFISVNQVLVVENGTLDLSQWTGDDSYIRNVTISGANSRFISPNGAGKINTLAFTGSDTEQAADTASLNGGRYDEIAYRRSKTIKLGDLLADGYAFRQNGTFLEYAKELKNKDTVENVEVVPCPHADAKDGKCLYCGKDGILARVGDTTYSSVSDAVAAWRANGGTLKLFDDYGQGADGNDLDLSSASAEWLTIDLNGHGFYKDCKINTSIKLSGGKALTITDSSGKGTGVFGPIDADRGTLTLESGHLQGLNMASSSTATILLKGGKLTGIRSSVPIFNLLPNGYALMDGGGLPVDPTITIYDSKTYTVKDSTNLYISSQNEGSAAIGSNTIPFALSLKTADSEIGRMGFTWYIVKENGTTQKLAATTSDVTPGTDGVYTCNAANMTVNPDGWTDLKANETYKVLCVVNGKTSDGTSKWQTPMRGYKLTVAPADLSQEAVVFKQIADDDWGAMGNIGDGKGTFVFTPWGGNTDQATELSYLFEVSCNGRKLTAGSDYTVTGGDKAVYAGKYTLTIEGKGNYTGTAAHTWRIEPYKLTRGNYRPPTITKVYDGTTGFDFSKAGNWGIFTENVAHRPNDEKTGKNPVLGSDGSAISIYLKPEDFKASAVALDSPDAGDRTASFTIELKTRDGQREPNFAFEDGGSPTIQVTGAAASITKAPAPTGLANGALTVYNGTAKTYEIDIASLLPSPGAGCRYGEIYDSQTIGFETYKTEITEIKLDSSYYDKTADKAKIEKGKLILPIRNVNTTTTGKIGTIKLNVISQNYHHIKDWTIDVSAANQPVSSSGGGGGSSSGGTVKTDTVTNPDGSVTKTETKSDGTVVETTTGKDGSTTKTETKKDGSSVTESKDAAGSTGTVKTDKNGNTEAETKVSAKAVEDAKKSGEAVKAPVEVKATRNSDTAPTVKVELPKGAGETKVEIPVTNVKPGTVAVLVHPDGTEEIIKNSLPTEDGIQLTVNGGATVKIVDNSKDFIDTRNHWAKDAIDFVSARGLVSGMSGTTYAPDASTTRAQLWTILARQNNANLSGGNTWYEKAQLWSKDKGISDGTNPNGTINRAQMVTMLWRAMGQPAAGGAANFNDVPANSYYAQAVAWAVENGITTGVGGGRFDPNSTCTRAQIAAFLARSMK